MTEYDRGNRRGGRPQREFYTPGSGPLRKSSARDGSLQTSESGYRNGLDKPTHYEEVSKISEELKKVSLISNSNKNSEFLRNGEGNKKIRKPGSEIYVPKPVAQRLNESFHNEYTNRQKDDQRGYSNNNAPESYKGDVSQRNGYKSNEKSGKKRDKKKKPNSNNEMDRYENNFNLKNARSKESLNSQDRGENRENTNRFIRHGSEPRSLPYYPDPNSRVRDTRSVEPGGSGSWNQQDKTHNKPPAGHQNKRNTARNLPPRLKKKYMAENGILDSSEDLYSSMSDQNRSNLIFHNRAESFHNEPYQQTFKPPPQPPIEWSKTLPNPARGRGRGLRRDAVEGFRNQRLQRSLTPEKFIIETNVNSSNFNNDLYEPRDDRTTFNSEEKENQDTGCSTPSNCEGFDPASTRYFTNSNLEYSSLQTGNSRSTEVLDWAAEVERTLSRSNSKESFTEPAVMPSKGKRKKKRRSLSRDELPRGSRDSHKRSNDNLFNHSRHNSAERNWRNRSRQNSNCEFRSRENSHDRQYNRRQGSRRNSFCDSRSHQNSPDRQHGRWHGSRHTSPDRQFKNQGSRHNSPDRQYKRQGSRRNSTCENRSRQNSPYRQPRRQGSRNNSISENRSRQSSIDRKESRNQRNWSKPVPKLVEETNWRLEQHLASKETESKQAGIIVLPQPISTVPKYSPPVLQKRLFDPSNPDKMIVVPSSRVSQDQEQNYHPSSNPHPDFSKILIPANDPLMCSQQTPAWYNPYKENFQQSHNPQIIREIATSDLELQYLLGTGEMILCYWDSLQQLRYYLKERLRIMLMTDLRFCQAENVEQHLWKILYYNIIELLRKYIVDNPQRKEEYKRALLSIIEEGSEFYEQLLTDLETNNKIKMDKYLNAPSFVREGLGHLGLTLIAAQKIYLCLGDLARYKEQCNDSPNYYVARQWYIKAHQINPKNGRPYHQLAILAMYTKRRLDAVYYYMRCLMSSNPMPAARDSLNSLFDDNRKKYEAVDRKRKEERAQKEREKMKEKEGGGGYRREIWIHPGGGKNVHRTTSTCQPDIDSADEELYAATNIEVNKRFCMSYLHVHGKIFTKIGLESLSETIQQMLREFRALLQHSPIPLGSTRFLQLFALNMFAIEVTQPKGDMGNGTDGCYRSALQESALVASLQMFNLLLERFVKILQEHLSQPITAPTIPLDCQAILPALKVWCDWLTTHFETWNPPPSCQDYKVGPPGDCWTRLATLVNLLEKLNFPKDLLYEEKTDDSEIVYLPEDATLAGFAPLMANSQEPYYVHKDVDMELAQNCLRIQKILFFGSVFLCGLDPPVLKLQKCDSGESEFISVVDTPGSQDQCKTKLGIQSDMEVCESMSSSDESDDSGKATGVEEDDGLGETLQSLIMRKDQLERQHRKQQARNKNLQKAISMSEVMTVMEVRPHDLVPDTNCFIDCLPQIEALLKMLPNPQYPYVIMVPLVVMNELEGLSKGCKPSQSALHAAMVRETARAAMALFQKKHPALRCVTTKGSVLISPTFTVEEDSVEEMKNDDKILTTCVNISKSHTRDEVTEGGRKKLYREVVLLTDDKSLRLKAISRDMPVRSLADFMKWAGLG